MGVGAGSRVGPTPGRVGAPSVALPSLTVRPLGPHLEVQMNAATATARPLAALAPARMPGRVPPVKHDETERVLTRGTLIPRLADAVLTTVSLGSRERRVLREVLAGRSCEAIARDMGLRTTTIHKHLHRIHAKTGTDSRRALYDFALRQAAYASIMATQPAFGLGRPGRRAAA